jgi:hypothetical protein
MMSNPARIPVKNSGDKIFENAVKKKKIADKMRSLAFCSMRYPYAKYEKSVI